MPFLIFSRLLGKKIVVKLSNSGQKSVFKKLQNADMLSRLVLLFSFKRIDNWICLNQTIVDELLLRSVPSKSISVIPNICPLQTREISLDTKLNTTDLNIVYIAAMYEHKDPYLALRIAQEMATEKSCFFHFIGDGPLLHELSKSSNQNIIFHGQLCRDQLCSILSSSHVYLSTSLAEGMSNSLLEALAFGLIPLVTNIEANSNILGSDYSYLLESKSSIFIKHLRDLMKNNYQPLDNKKFYLDSLDIMFAAACSIIRIFFYQKYS